MGTYDFVSCYTCKNKILIVAGEDEAKFWECSKTGFFLEPEELKMKRHCIHYEPDPIARLSDKEAALYTFLLDIGDPLIVDSIPKSYRGALGKLKKLHLIKMYNTSVKVRLNGEIVWKKTKVVKAIGGEEIL